jgi:hypothetical protein
MTLNEQLAAYLRPRGSADTPATPMMPPAAAAARTALMPLEADVCDELREQRIGPLLHQALCRQGLLDAQPAAVRDAVRRASREEALLEPFRHDAVVAVLDALGKAGVRPIVFKGTALAYTCYPEPFLRPRLDTDLLIRRGDFDRVCDVVERLGFTRALQTSGDYVTHQCAFVGGSHGVRVALDVHWKMADPQAFADLFPFDELERAAVDLPALGAYARTVSDPHALLVACMHRVAHHYDREYLLDAHDITLLAGRLGRDDWEMVVALARSKRLCQVTARGLALAASRLGAAVPADVLERLASSVRDEPTAAYLTAGLRKVDLLRADLARLGWRARLQLLREHVFPSPAFVLRSYGQTSSGLVPILYLVRIVRGAASWFRPLR